jgi:hypothetical protein
MRYSSFPLRTDAKPANDIEDYSSIFRTQLVFGVWRCPNADSYRDKKRHAPHGAQPGLSGDCKSRQRRQPHPRAQVTRHSRGPVSAACNPKTFRASRGLFRGRIGICLCLNRDEAGSTDSSSSLRPRRGPHGHAVEERNLEPCETMGIKFGGCPRERAVDLRRPFSYSPVQHALWGTPTTPTPHCPSWRQRTVTSRYPMKSLEAKRMRSTMRSWSIRNSCRMRSWRRTASMRWDYG